MSYTPEQIARQLAERQIYADENLRSTRTFEQNLRGGTNAHPASNLEERDNADLRARIRASMRARR